MSESGPSISWSSARSILAVRLDNAGDVIMLGPALRAVKAGLPGATINTSGEPCGERRRGPYSRDR